MKFEKKKVFLVKAKNNILKVKLCLIKNTICSNFLFINLSKNIGKLFCKIFIVKHDIRI